MLKAFENFFLIITLPLALPMNAFIRSKRGDKIGKKLSKYPRFINWIWATWGGLFWLPCPICGKNFGGHEPSGTLMHSYNHGEGVCSSCDGEAGRQNEINAIRFREKEVEHYSRFPYA